MSCSLVLLEDAEAHAVLALVRDGEALDAEAEKLEGLLAALLAEFPL